MIEGTELDYVGDELTIFALAKRWKTYFRDSIAPHIKGTVAEVGAGRGTTTLTLCDPAEREVWLCIEPDRTMATELQQMCAEGHLPERCEAFLGVLANLPVERQFDTILYVDVLEHIEDDRHELAVAATHLTARGRIIVLSPAWPHLYSPFDRKIGHYRRYTKRSLGAHQVAGLDVEAAYHLDCIGYAASFVNRLMLKQDLPTRTQVLFWDRWIVPFLEYWTRSFFGRSDAASLRSGEEPSRLIEVRGPGRTKSTTVSSAAVVKKSKGQISCTLNERHEILEH